MRFPYSVFLPVRKLTDLLPIKLWCEEQYGERFDAHNFDGAWTYVWAGVERERTDEYEYRFTNEKDAMLFILRWK